ncbi:MAG: hypothetical protein DHS20C11_07620 [Lysobacteraceae bacterium]|nr:MAG: hypothetical protein DHS20C11_07620 [Xanthomonadaceae bacterium]
MNKQRPTEAMLGKTIAGVIARPKARGLPQVIVLQFTDGSCFEFLSPVRLATSHGKTATAQIEQDAPVQLALTA